MTMIKYVNHPISNRLLKWTIDPDDPEAAWLEMLETRHTRWINVGSKDRPGLIFNERGPMFEAVPVSTSAAGQTERSV